MIHWILQFTLLIAFRCVLHRCESQEIRCWKLYFVYRHWSLVKHSVTYNGVYEKHRPGNVSESRRRKTHSNPHNWVASESYPGLQEVHRWRYKDDRRALVPEETSYNPSGLFNNDPSAGSPTETLLRLLLPLNDQVWSASQQKSAVAGSLTPIRRPH